jgi:hypothetical protein
MGTNPVQSRVQEGVSSSPENGVKTLFLSMAGPYTTVPMIPTYMEILKDGKRLIMRPMKSDSGVSNWLKSFVGLDATISVPPLGVSWTSRVSYRRGQGYVYVRIPANLRKYFISLWRSGMAVPVLISIPPVALATRVPEVVRDDQ